MPASAMIYTGGILLCSNFIEYFFHETPYAFIVHACMKVACKSAKDPSKWLNDPFDENKVNTILNDNLECGRVVIVTKVSNLDEEFFYLMGKFFGLIVLSIIRH